MLIGGRPAFKRTPKVRSRTTPGFTFIVMPYVFVAFSVLTLLSDLHRDRWVNVVLAGVNAVLAGYAIVAYIGVGRSVVDVWHNVLSWLYKPQRTVATKRVAPRLAVAEGPAAHWSQTLAYAPADGVRRMERRKSSRRGAPPGGDRRSPLGDRRGAPIPDENGVVPANLERRAPTQDEEQR
ncbi:MAG: hypothetical protein V7607_1960 [Solirubrobacteraceae bacterium]